MLDIKNVSLMVGSRTLIDNASATVFSGDKIGIVGHNGCGKTTLLRAIMGDISVDFGTISLAKSTAIVCVKQEIEDNSIKLLDFIISADLELSALRKKLHNSDGNVAEIYDQISAIDGDSADARAATILSGLGFKNEDLEKSLSAFSGGWQTRASLAATLFAPADIIILDEPTNHLDLESVIWLESFLTKSTKTLLIVSHEKSFLDGICNKIINIDNGKLKMYSGNYSTFVRTKSEQERMLSKMIESQEQKREHIQTFVDRFRYKASKAKQVQSRIKMLNKMEVIERQDSNYDVQFKFSEPAQKVDRRLVTLEKIDAGYGEKIVLRNVNLNIDFGERVALLGANGNGKSTLAKIISKRIQPFSGTIECARSLKIAYFSQQQTDELDVKLTASETFHIHHPELNETQIRSALANFGLIKARSQTRIELLSGGEKTRLLLAIITSKNPHMLILDEPTNHLDIEAREALIEALRQYGGAAILITHDFYTLKACCDHFYIIDNKACSPFNGTLEDYRTFLLSQRETSSKNKKTDQKKIRPFDKKLAKEISSLEGVIKQLSVEKLKLESKLGEEYSNEAYVQYAKISAQLDRYEERWISLADLTENGQ